MTGGATQPALEVVEVQKAYGPVRALDGVSLAVSRGEILAVLGPSGSGKSTLLAVIAGLEAPDAGDVRWQGRSLTEVPPHRRDFGLMFQDYMLFPHMNVAENIAFGLRMKGWPPARCRERVREMLALVGLEGFETRAVDTLSGGEQQRVALARALAPGPRLLMLDEPLGALDRTLREELMLELPRQLHTLGQTALYVTHDQEEAFAVADRVVILRAGRVVQEGTPEAIYARPASPFVARFLGLHNLIEGQVVEVDGRRLLRTPFGDLPAADSRPGRRTLLLRPERARLGDGRGLRLEGVVRERSFRGGLVRLLVEVQGTTLAFDFSAVERLPRAGERVSLTVDPEEGIQVLE